MKCLFIINPISGRGNGGKIFDKVKHLFSEAGYDLETRITKCLGEFKSIARDLDFSRFGKIIIVGGDGSLNEFVNGMKEREDGMEVPIGLIPAGTGNSLMFDLKQLDPINAAQCILKGKARKIDLMKVTCGNEIHYAFNVVGWGLPSTINQKSENWKLFGGQRYNIASLQEIIRNPSWLVQISIEKEDLTSGNYCFFMACNTIHTGKGMRIAPKAKLDDGLMDIVMLRKAPRHKLVRLFSRIFSGDHIEDPIVYYSQQKKVKVEGGDEGPLIIDGQIVGSTPFEMEVIRGGLALWN